MYGEPISGSPFGVVIRPAEPSPDHSLAYGDALGPYGSGAIAGQCLRLGVLLRDKYRNVCTDGVPPPSLRLHLRGASELDGHVEGAGGEGDGSGSIEATAHPKIAGRYWAHLTLDGEHLAGSPYSLHVRPAPPLPAACEAWGDGLTNAAAGTLAYFAVALRDEWGNFAVDDADLLTARLEPPSQPPRPFPLAPQAPGGPREIECSLHVGDGLGGAGGGNELLKGVGGVVVSGTCCSTLAGRHLLVLELAGEHVAGSPFEVDVRPGATHAASCSLQSATQLETAQAGQAVHLAYHFKSAVVRQVLFAVFTAKERWYAFPAT